MNTINVDLSTGEALNLPIGRQGENNVTQVIFDFSGLKTEFGSGTLSLSVKRPKEYIPYAQTMTVSGNTATWLVNETDTGNFGCGEIQLTYTVSGKVAKTVIYKYTVLRSIGADGEYPIPGQTWQEEMESEIDEIKEDLSNIDSSGVPSNVRTALYNLLNAAAYASTGHTSDIATVQSWASSVTAISLNQSTASITGTGTVQLVATTTPAGGAVSWQSSDTSIATVSASGLVTGVNNGTVTITATSGSASATCSVTVSGNATLSSISAVYTQSGTVYDTDTLDSLKTDLVVTAHYSNSSTSTVASSAYTLSGTLTTGTSTITVSYGGKTTTFNVTVTEAVVLPTYQLATMTDVTGTNCRVSVEDVDRIIHTVTSNSGQVYIRSDGTAGTGFGNVVWFGLESGDSYVLKIKNISYENNNTTNNYFAVAFKDSTTTTKITSGNQYVANTGNGTLEDVEISGSMSESVGNVCLFAFAYRPIVLTYDVELYVNGERYV